MAIQKADIVQFLSHAVFHPVLDVRSPAEFQHAHIPGAISLPLFSDEERKVVGTLYKQRSREEAIKEGLDYFGPKMRGMVEKVQEILASKTFSRQEREQEGFVSDNCVLVHCWRGGMRSGAVAWLLDLYGFRVISLEGGYKKFRHYVLESFDLTLEINILGGYTGSGKSLVLKELQQERQLVIDLEEIAQHKGSAFGAMATPQPGQEMFENLLAMEIRRAWHLHQQPGNSLVTWLEDESQRIGSVNIPQSFWNTMRRAPVFFLDIPFEERLDHIVAEYGRIPTEKLINAIIRISKRLGGLETKTAISALVEGNIRESFAVLLRYYDKHYIKGLMNRENLEELLVKVPAEKVHAKFNSEKIIKHAQIASEENG